MQPDTLRIRHNEAVIRLNWLLTKDQASDAMTLGQSLMDLGFDKITDGFWILDLNNDIEFYSPKFRESLGFEGEHDFPSIPLSWQKAIEPQYVQKALDDYLKHKEDPKNEYYLKVGYNTKDGGKLRLICAGSIVNRDQVGKEFMIGTHEIIV